MLFYSAGFNRYMVECEYGLLSKGATDDDVLIDTWWNVNKAAVTKDYDGFISFNRYMVECE